MLSSFGESFSKKRDMFRLYEVTSRFSHICPFAQLPNHCNWNLWLQIDPHCCGEIPPIDRPKRLTTRFPWSWTACSHALSTNLKSNLAAWSWCTWICQRFFFTWNKLFPLSKGSSTFSMIFWYILVHTAYETNFQYDTVTRVYRLSTVNNHQWAGIYILSSISFSSFISPEKLLSHCLPPLRRW